MEIEKDNSGLIFKNTKKTEDKHPDYKGQIKVNGAVKDIGLWVRKDKNGASFFGVLLNEPKSKEQSTQPTQNQKDDLPF